MEVGRPAERGSLYDRSACFAFARPDGRTLFDFQRVAADFCARRLAQQLGAVLALDTGLGKTCTVRAALQLLDARALVLCPGGLVQQVAAGLERFPWEAPDAPGWSVGRAETGRQLTQARERAEGLRVLVVNRALADCHGLAERFDVVVADEAHQEATLRAVRRFAASRPVLFVTACPSESVGLADFFASGRRRTPAAQRDFAEACFVVQKTPRVLQLLGVARPRVVLVDVALAARDLKRYDEHLLGALKSSGARLDVRLRLLAAAAALLPRLAPEAARAAREALVEHLAPREGGPRAAPEAGALARVRALLAAQGLSLPPGLPPEAPASLERVARCGCCELLAPERGVLYELHQRALPTDVPPLWTLAGVGGRFTSAIVRFKDRRHLEQTLSAFPVPPEVQALVLTSDRSAAQRARLVRKFASHDGQRANLAVLKRALKRQKAPELLLRVGALGMGQMLLRAVELFLARPRLLLADATVDVGYDLHRHVDGVHVPRLVETHAELLQLTGRVSRISVGQRDQGEIDVLANCFGGTLDAALFARHLLEAEGEAEAEAPAERARRLLACDGEALRLFEELLARAPAR